MRIRIGLENNIENRSLAWALDFPGCFAFGEDEAEALIRLPKALLKYEIWIKDHTPSPWIHFDDLDLYVAERVNNFWMKEDYTLGAPGEGYEINAWFKDDWRPLTAIEIDHGLKIYNWQREELLAGISTIEPGILEMQRPGERMNIYGILKHIANAELYYLNRLKLVDADRSDLKSDPQKRLAQTRKWINDIFPEFEDRVDVRGVEGEFWSFRKILRRTLWHQRDHIEHIKKLVFGDQKHE